MRPLTMAAVRLLCMGLGTPATRPCEEICKPTSGSRSGSQNREEPGLSEESRAQSK